MCIAGDCGSHGLAGGEEGKERETDVLESLPNRVVDQVPSCLHNPLIERKRKKERKKERVALCVMEGFNAYICPSSQMGGNHCKKRRK